MTRRDDMQALPYTRNVIQLDTFLTLQIYQELQIHVRTYLKWQAG